MNMRPPEPLTEEERDLAARIARLGPHGEPSPALDAKILAAAHSATAAAPRGRRPRWPVFTGVAASVLLAAGIVWQLRPPQEHQAPVAFRSEAPMPAAREIAASEAPAAEAAPMPVPPLEPPPAAAPPLPPAAAKAAPPAPKRTAAPPPVVPPAAAPAPAEAEIAAMPAGALLATDGSDRMPLADQAVFVAEPPAARSASASASAANDAYATTRQADAAQAERRRAQPAASAREYAPSPPAPPAPVAEDAATLDSIVVTGAKAGLAAIPVEQDAKLSRRKWLRRIGERHAQGDNDGARESLRRFVHKYPRTELPPELRELLEE